MHLPGYGKEVAPGIWEFTHEFAVIGNMPLTPWRWVTLNVNQGSWPFREGESLYTYAKRVVAEVDPTGRVESAEFTLDTHFRFGMEPIVEERVEVKYLTEKGSQA